MPYVIYRNRVEDYARWKRAFDEGDERRRAGGIKNPQVFRNPEDPTEVLVLCEVDSVDRGRQHFQSPMVREVQQRSGVREHAEYYPEQ